MFEASTKGMVSEEDQSEFNSAIATLMRIDAIKKGLIITTAQENYEMQFRYLKALFKELISVMNTEDDKYHKKRFLEVRENYYLYKKLISEGKNTVPRSIVDSFDDWEIELKNTEQKYGMNMPKKADPRWAMAGTARRRF